MKLVKSICEQCVTETFENLNRKVPTDNDNSGMGGMIKRRLKKGMCVFYKNLGKSCKFLAEQIVSQE